MAMKVSEERANRTGEAHYIRVVTNETVAVSGMFDADDIYGTNNAGFVAQLVQKRHDRLLVGDGDI